MGDFARNSFWIEELAEALLLSDEQIAQLGIIAERSHDAISAIVTDQNRRHEAMHRILESKQNTLRIQAALKSLKASRRELSAALRAVITRINELLDRDQKTVLASFAPQFTETELIDRIADLLSQDEDDSYLGLRELVSIVDDPLFPQTAQSSHRSQDLLGILMITPDFLTSTSKDLKTKETP